jgi:hypothetical protein
MDDFDGRKDFSTRDETSYRFLYRMPKKEGMIFWGVVALGLLMALVHERREGEDMMMWAYLTLLAIVMLCHLFLRASLLVGPEGLSQQWKTGPFSFSRHIAWQEVAQVQLGNPFLIEPGFGFRRFYFLDTLGNLKRQVDFTRYGVQVYVGAGHAFSLLQTIEKFHAVTEQTTIERAKLALEVYKIGGKQVRIVAVALMFFLVFLIPFSHTCALETVKIHQAYKTLYLAIGMISFLAACVYTCLDKEARFPQALVPSALLGIACALLVMPLIDAVPAWLGEKHEEVFAVVREEDKAQHWQGTVSPDLAFTLFIPPEKRAHQGVGSAKTFTIYRGPFGLASMEREEFRALFAGRSRTSAKNRLETTHSRRKP